MHVVDTYKEALRRWLSANGYTPEGKMWVDTWSKDERGNYELVTTRLKDHGDAKFTFKVYQKGDVKPPKNGWSPRR